MKQTEFIEKYCKASNITEEELNKAGRFSVLCNCNQGECKGWAMVSKETLQSHIDLYL